jgi:hypothetical protein
MSDQVSLRQQRIFFASVRTGMISPTASKSTPRNWNAMNNRGGFHFLCRLTKNPEVNIKRS